MNTINSNTLTIGAGLGGSSGQSLIASTIGPTWSSSTMSDPGLFVKGNAEITGTLTVGGQEITKTITKTIDERLSAIEERLCILRIDEKLADRWEELGKLRKQYRELEQECWEKDEIVRILKGIP